MTNGPSYKQAMIVNYDSSVVVTSRQSYKHFTLVNYDSWVVIWGIFQSGTTLES